MNLEAIVDELKKPSFHNFDRVELMKHYQEPVTRYLGFHLPDGIPGNDYANIKMKGIIKLVNWAQFTSVLHINPFLGFLWKATVKMGILPVKGYDYFFDGKGAMNWELFRWIPFMKADGPDVSRSGEGRTLLESSFLPHALINPAVKWDVISDNEITATWKIFREEAPLHFRIGDDGSLKEITMMRWGNPGDNKIWDYHVFGVGIEQEAKVKGVVIPVKGNAGWWYGTDNYRDGEFFRFEVK
nr:hypothetical protein [Bacteroidota bacterium]